MSVKKRNTLFINILIGVSGGVLLFSLLFIFFRKTEWIDVVIKTNEESVFYQFNNNPNWYVNHVKPGMKELDVLGRKTAEIKDSYYYSYPFDRSLKTNLFLKVGLKATYSPTKKTHTFKGKEVLVGSNVELNLDDLFVKGVVVDINSRELRNSITLKVRGQIVNNNPVFSQTEGVPEFFARKIEQTNMSTDFLGNPLITIVKKDIRNATIVTTDMYGNVSLQPHPTRKDIYVDLEIHAQKIGKYYYLYGDDSLPILIGHDIPFLTKEFVVWITITEMFNEKR